ncbi:hypothetical protein BT96DRAFT_915338, partial [Gymnopus androsaceus JB14]
MSSLNSSQNQDDVQSGSRGTEYAATSNEPINEAKPGATSGDVDLEEETPSLPQISNDFGLDLDSIISAGDPELTKLNKRASNVQKLAQENEKLKAELKAMSDRLEAAERKRQELSRKKQGLKEPPS